MKLLRGVTVIPAVAAMAMVTILSSATPSDAKTDRVRFRCKAETETEKMDARFEEVTQKKKTRKTFRTHFEGSGTGLVAGALLSVRVDEVAVGTITLVEEVPGEVEGQLRFDSKAKPRPGKPVQPFPVTFPLLTEDSLVDLQLAGVTVLACELN